MNNEIKINEIKINIPEGMEIDVANSTFECIKFKKIEKKLPKSWKDLNYIDGYYINNGSGVGKISDKLSTSEENKNIFPTEELAEAALALAQLLQLREAYNNGWQPDWTNGNETKYSIFCSRNELTCKTSYNGQVLLSFKTSELRDEFLKNFRDLIEIAKPLI